MKHLPTSSNFDFHVFPKEDMNAYIHRGFQVHKSIGFEGVDLDLYLLEAMGENWRACVENMVAMSEEFGIGFPQCHLPFISQTQGEPDPTFDKKIREAIDAAKMMMTRQKELILGFEPQSLQAKVDLTRHIQSIVNANKRNSSHLDIRNATRTRANERYSRHQNLISEVTNERA